MSKFLLTIFLFMFGIGAILEGREDAAFQSRGETVQIQSIENLQARDVYKRQRGFGERKLVRYYSGDVIFQSKAGNVVIVPSRTLPPDVLDALKNGNTITIQYLPEQPATIRFAGRLDGTPIGLQIVGFLLIILGVFCVIRALRN
jgi:hypothetical protein